MAPAPPAAISLTSLRRCRSIFVPCFAAPDFGIMVNSSLDHVLRCRPYLRADGTGPRHHRKHFRDRIWSMVLNRDGILHLGATVARRSDLAACLSRRGPCTSQRLNSVAGFAGSDVDNGRLRLLQRGGRERESNPPRTGSRPLPDLKSGRPTGDESLPESAVLRLAGSAARRNRSRRCLLMWRRSPRRKVTPWRSKNSRIWIATLRPFSTLSRNCAAVNWPSAEVAPRSTTMPTISATVSRRKK